MASVLCALACLAATTVSDAHTQPAFEPILGTADGDTLRGTPAADLIRGRAGDDLIHAGRGDDRLIGGPGADELRGDPGADQLDARDPPRPAQRCSTHVCIPRPADADLIDAGPGNDTLNTRDGRPDTILCGPGDDLVIADPTDLYSTQPSSACETIEASSG